MKLQVALDVVTMDEARAVLSDVVNYVDIVEIGLLFYSHGYDALTTLKAEYPQVEYLADVKIVDGGYWCTLQAHEMGADYVTVLGGMDDETVGGAIRAAGECGIGLVVDLTGVHNFYERVKQLDAMGAPYLNIHTPFDLQQKNNSPFEQLSVARMLVGQSKLSVAGGITADTIADVVTMRPDIVVAGSALLKPETRVAAAKAMRQAIDAAAN